MSNNVPTGLATVLGLFGAAASAVISVAQSVAHNQALFTGQSKPAALIATVSLVATVLGRMFQAAHLPVEAKVAGEVGGIPDALAALAAEAQGNVAKLAASPDGKDGPNVPFSGAS